jgi:hypothetical protein
VSLALGAYSENWPVSEDDPFVNRERLPEGTDPRMVSRYGDRSWDLSPLAGPSIAGQSLNLESFGAPLRETFRRAAWALINLPIGQDLLDRVGSNRVRWPSVGTMMLTFQAWRGVDAWLSERDITRLCDVRQDDLQDYAAAVATRRNAPVKALYSVSLLWGYAPHLLEHDRMVMPPWEDGAMRDYLPTRAGGIENNTPPIHPAVMSPLLIWAMRFVDEFAEDILAAWQERQRLTALIPAQADPGARQRIRDVVNRHREQGQPLPGHRVKARTCAAITYLSAVTRATPGQVTRALREFGADLPVSTQTPLSVQPRGLLHGRVWKTQINFHESPILMVRLSAACTIVLFYLSGMRAGEGLSLQVGCSPAPDTAEGETVRAQIHGRFFKNARDQDGKHVADGLPRTIPWAVIPPVVRAVRVLERMSDGPDLFTPNPGWSWAANGGRRARAGKVLTSEAANDRIQLFITWVNEFAQVNDLAAERIPDDPDGLIVLSRLRRTIAWHIARLPGGRIALSTQYGHLRTVIGEGYSGHARAGLRRILDVETARAMADHLDQLDQRIHDGEAVSGPAARRMINAARDARTRFGGMFLTPKQADALMSEPQFHVYDNPDAFLTCNHDPLKALCHPERTKNAGREPPPALDRCDRACANIARTDTHIEQLEHECAQLGEQISSPLTPMPLRERLKQRTTALEAITDRHHKTRIVDGRGNNEETADDDR